ncbi:hypothetical protein B0H10DRAFT_878634 [Mycena sp. CBHHK59/15]|nr:hypothetical protein B0H10DRAFT_878634 [Mycena sp. CBHHK59/15]
MRSGIYTDCTVTLFRSHRRWSSSTVISWLLLVRSSLYGDEISFFKYKRHLPLFFNSDVTLIPARAHARPPVLRSMARHRPADSHPIQHTEYGAGREETRERRRATRARRTLTGAWVRARRRPGRASRYRAPSNHHAPRATAIPSLRRTLQSTRARPPSNPSPLLPAPILAPTHQSRGPSAHQRSAPPASPHTHA